jgi:hypothetical protein
VSLRRPAVLRAAGPSFNLRTTPTPDEATPRSFTINHLRTRPDGTARFTLKLPGGPLQPAPQRFVFTQPPNHPTTQPPTDTR